MRFLKRECSIDNILDEYNFDSDRHDVIQSGIQQRFDEMRYGTLKERYSENPDLGFKVMLWNMCPYLELNDNNSIDSVSAEIESKERFSGIDPNPLIIKYNKECIKKGLPYIHSYFHEEVDEIVDFVSEAMKYSRFYREFVDKPLRDSSLAFFPDMDTVPHFNMRDYKNEIENEIDSLSADEVVQCKFPHLKLSKQIISDFIKEALITYFARLEYNSVVNSLIHERTPDMVRKLYGKELSESADFERVVSQTFVAHDWIRDEKDDWINSCDSEVLIKGKIVRRKDYLVAGEQSLLFELIPKDITQSQDLDNYFGKGQPFFGGKTYRLISEDAAMEEWNDTQAADLGDKLKSLISRPDEYFAYAEILRNKKLSHGKRRPTMVVRKYRSDDDNIHPELVGVMS